ncbi:dihydrofolate reductase family protein [Arthrobacter sp. Br18]|uniref:dihydrofolate reductase family protein n=1 Tax=Arthrobacter sp. Br18 TaxID=1312954 RepID=UPI00047B7C15|nr:dihydrofolate reductase family protein [Arthrobacter sp. Br18]
MALLLYASITSLDGYVADEEGSFDWGVPDEELHTFINDLQRPIGTYLYGRGLYEVMVAWETMPTAGDPILQDYAEIWQAAQKIVYSSTLPGPSSRRTRLERHFIPAAVEQLKAAESQDLVIGGAELAAGAFAADLIDEIHQFVSPVVVGGGKPFLPKSIRLGLALRDERRFANGVVYLRYSIER